MEEKKTKAPVNKSVLWKDPKTLSCLKTKHHYCWELWDFISTDLYRQTKEETVKTGLQVSLHESNNFQQHDPLLMAEIQITLHFQLEGEPTNTHSLDESEETCGRKALHHQIWAHRVGWFFSDLNLYHPCHQHSTNKSENEFSLSNIR